MGLLGLDLASRRTGWCVGDGSGLPTCGAWAFPPVKAEDGSYDFGLLLSTLDEYLTNCHARHGFEAVAYEAPILVFQRRDESGAVVRNDNLSTLRLLYPLGAFVEYWCHRRGIACYEVSVQAIKKELGGHRNAAKADLVFVAEKVGLQLPPGAGREDAADAFGAWLCLLRALQSARSADWDRRIYSPRGALL